MAQEQLDTDELGRELELTLLQAADILRGTVKRERYISYILPLLLFKRLSDVYEEELLFKRLSDVYEEEHQEFDAKYKNEQTVRIESHRFVIPDGCLWQDMLQTPRNIGQTLNNTLTKIAGANPSLSGVINRTDFAKQDELPQETLAKLTERFSLLKLSNIDVTWDTLGNVCENLIRKFTEVVAEQVGQFYTPREVIRTMVEILAPDEANTVYDPCCGSGGSFIESYNYLKRVGRNPEELSLYGQEINGDLWAMAVMNTTLHNLDAAINQGNSFALPAFLNKQRFDIAIAHPVWNEHGLKALMENDVFRRFKFGIAPDSSADWGWVQHMLAALKPAGKMGIALDRGALYRSGSAREKSIRKSIVENDLIECIVVLPDRSFLGTSDGGCLLFLNKNKPRERKGKILFICATCGFEQLERITRLREEDIDRIKTAFKDWRDIDNFARVISLDLIQKNDYILDFEQDFWLAPYIKAAVNEGLHPVKLGTIKRHINKGVPQKQFSEELNAIYVPRYVSRTKLAPVVTSISGLTLQPQHYVQIVLDEAQANASYVAHFLNSDFGKMIRASPFNRTHLDEATVYLPLKDDQDEIIGVDQAISNYSKALEVGEILPIEKLREELWADLKRRSKIKHKVEALSKQKSGSKSKAGDCERSEDEYFIRWMNSLPYPLARILTRCQAKADEEKKVDLLISFFETLALFNAVVMLSAYVQDEKFYKEKCGPSLYPQKYDYRLKKPAIGDWNEVSFRLADVTRKLRRDERTRGKVLNLFEGPDSENLIQALTTSKLNDVLSKAAEYRNDWEHGHTERSEEYTNGFLKKLKKCVFAAHMAICYRYSSISLFAPITYDMEDEQEGTYKYIIRKFVGAGDLSRQEKIQCKSKLESGLYLARFKKGTQIVQPIRLLPFIRLEMCGHADGKKSGTKRYAFYSYNGLSKHDVTWKSQDCPELGKLTKLKTDEDFGKIRKALCWFRSE